MDIARWGAWIAPFSGVVLAAQACMVCDKEFARKVEVIIGLYVKRISEGMGKDSKIGRAHV